MVHISEVTHAGGKVDGSSTISHFDFAPGAVRVREAEQIDGSVALIFASLFWADRWCASPMSWVGSHRALGL
jgi:hypothetical protein